MTHTYNITGLTCENCVSKAKSQLLMLGDVSEAAVQLASPQATISMQKHIPLSALQNALNKAGNFTITEAGGAMHHSEAQEQVSWLSTYKPVLLIGGYITAVTLLAEIAGQNFDWENWMQHFMAGFFLAFSFFKMLDLKGFAESYSTYDIIGKKWMGWGYVYAFLELALGMAYLLKFDPVLTNAATFVVMSVSIIGVLQSVLSKQKIKCACLGTGFNLPMSSITIIEDALMILMSAAMLLKTFQ
jgi:cation transport ATPase